MFTVNKEKLFYLTLGGISANNFTIEEIQTENGYVIFSAAENKYLATIAGIDAQNSILKITPCNDIYFFPPGIFLNMFRILTLLLIKFLFTSLCKKILQEYNRIIGKNYHIIFWGGRCKGIVLN